MRIFPGLFVLAAMAYGQNPSDGFQTANFSNLNVTDSIFTFTNTSASSVCVNTYAFDTQSEMVACCSILLAANSNKLVSARTGLISNTLTGVRPTGGVVKIATSAPVAGTCDPASNSVFTSLVGGLQGSTQPPPTPFQTAQFNSVPNDPNNPAFLTNVCNFIQLNGSGFGTCSSAGFIVVPAPKLTKSFAPAAIPPGGVSVLTLQAANASDLVAITGVGFTDTLPSGLTVAMPNGLTTTCSGTTTAVAGSSSVSLSGSGLDASGTCSISVNVTSTTPGPKVNVAGPITSIQSGSASNLSNSATLTVQQPPTLSKAFGSSQIYYYTGANHTTLTFTVANPAGNASLTNVSFVDTLPPGLVVNSPNALTGSCPAGAISAVAGSQTISLAGAALSAGSTCTFSVDVRGVGLGTQVNTTSPVTADGGSSGTPASATVVVNGTYYLWFFAG